MKLKINKAAQEVKGVLDLDLKFITAQIEYKWFAEPNQLNLRLVGLRYKMKDAFARRKHNHDYMKRAVQESMLNKLQTQGVLAILCREGGGFKKPTIVWWEQ